MTGFKSFGNNTKVIDLAPGFTCIVGPNGSGKSNAIDALSFCLGTLSKKSMRAEKLTDLLFNGIKSKEPAKKTIVEIELDNSDLKIPVDETTVIISRELSREGVGVYKLNGKRTTRSNILDKLRIANIDCIDGYNIIQQGQIGEIVGMSGIQRRELLEGVAGIGQFETKKANAISELDEAQKKMGELNLLVNELTHRVEQLKKEKEAADKWIDLGKQIKSLNSELMSHRLNNIYNEVNTLNNDVKSLNEAINKLESEKQGILELKNIEEEVKEKQIRIEELENKSINLSETISNAKIELVKLEQQKEFNQSNKNQKKEDLNKFQVEKELASGSIEERRKQIDNIESQLQIMERQKEGFFRQRSKVESDIEERVNEYNAAKKEYEKVEIELQNTNEEINNIEVSKDISTSIAESFSDQKTKIENQFSKNKEISRKISSDIESVQIEIDKNTSKIQEISVKLSEYTEKFEKHSIHYKQTELKIRKHSEEKIILKTKKDMIKSSISAEEGENKAVTYILENKIKFKGVIDTLESVLGGKDKIPEPVRHLRNALVVENLESALNCIRKLKDGILGSCLFIPLHHMGITKINLGEEIDAKITSSVILVKDINEAKELWNKNKSIQIQTLDGDIFYPNGLINGGFHITSADKQLESLINLEKVKSDDINRLTEEKTMQERVINQIKKAIEITNESKLELENSIRDLIIQLQHLNEKQVQEKSNINRISSELEEIAKDELEKNTEINKFNRDLEELISIQTQIQMNLEESRIFINSLDVSGLREQRSSLSDKIIELEKQKIREEERRNSLENLIIPSNQRISQIDGEKVRIITEIENITEKSKGIAEGIKFNIETIWQKEQSMQELKKSTIDIKDEITHLQQKIKQTYLNNSKIEKQIQSNREMINEIKITRAKLETEREALFNEAKEKELEIIEKNERFKEVIPENHRKKIKKLNYSRKKLEPVNMRSFDDFQEEDKRLQETVGSRKLLTEERKVILDLISQLEIEKLNTFMRAFNRINFSFNSIFNELANGNAKLILENTEDIFEGGVSMEAHPDGKTLKTLESMSGGEKALTALAFIFAIQQSEPQPFYILDEIDAALDVKNVDKVGNLLAKMASGMSEFGKAQFIVISHRDTLMAKAETIYGTTNVKGITQMMQLRLDEKGLSTS